MADPHDHHDQLGAPDRIDDPVSADTDPVPISYPRQLFDTGGTGIDCQRSNGSDDALAILLLADSLDLFGRRGLEDDPITCHAA